MQCYVTVNGAPSCYGKYRISLQQSYTKGWSRWITCLIVCRCHESQEEHSTYLTMVKILKRKPCNPSRAAVPAKRWKITVADTPCTSAQAPKTSSRLNLTLSDWMTVYAYVDSHPDLTQADIVWHSTTQAVRRSRHVRSSLSCAEGLKQHYGGDPQFSVNLSFKLIKFRALLSREEMLTTKQATLEAYWKH